MTIIIYIYITLTFMHLADAFIQSDLHCIQVTVSTFYQLKKKNYICLLRVLYCSEVGRFRVGVGLGAPMKV